MKKLGLLLFAIVLFFEISCDKQIDLSAKDLNLLIPEEALKTPDDMQALLNSCYDATANMMDGRFQILGDLLADDIFPFINDGSAIGIYNRNSDQFNGLIGNAYSQPYFSIYRINVMDLYYDQIPGMTEEMKNRMKAEGKFLRALCHLETLKLWAQPNKFTPDNSHLGIILRERAKNEALPRSTYAKSIDLIVSDLKYAIDNLPEENGVYANKMGAKALLAKVYFLTANYTEALKYANDVINSGKYTLSDSLNRFDRDLCLSEIIFGFVAKSAVEFQRGAEFRSNYSAKGTTILGVSPQFYNLVNADSSDKRRSMFLSVVESGVTKYKTTKFDLSKVFAYPYVTLTELLLTRAECLAELNTDLTTSFADVNKIIKRAYGNNSSRILQGNESVSTLLDQIRLQRRIEMFAEGDRLQQFKRIAAESSTNPQEIRGAKWNCPGMILQFPSAEGTSSNFVFNPNTICN
jgi:hypothetical protein